MSCAICFILDQSKFLLSGNGLKTLISFNLLLHNSYFKRSRRAKTVKPENRENANNQYILHSPHYAFFPVADMTEIMLKLALNSM